MAVVHNVMIRALNAIYLQAPHIRPEQEKSFLQFAEFWYKAVEHHHRTEEEYFFPILEKMTGTKDGGLRQCVDYVRRCLSGEEKYSGSKLLEVIDSFGYVLWEHLRDEIPTFVDLRRYGKKLNGFFPRLTSEAGKTQQELGIFAGAVFLLVTHDVEYEDGIHIGFPPIPAVIKWGLINVAWWVHRDWWEFAPCDCYGKMKPLRIAAS
ncbi:hemerythrin HHE cation binding domain-containing protein [Rostrohypoxylon terebratum]|nr:hemerythrin HHE cation binding domain-containing protein [Rostrohypoxylon terebratum]